MTEHDANSVAVSVINTVCTRTKNYRKACGIDHVSRSLCEVLSRMTTGSRVDDKQVKLRLGMDLMSMWKNKDVPVIMIDSMSELGDA